MKKLMVLVGILILLCAACSSDKEKSNAHQKDESTKTESKQKDNSKNESKANEDKPKQAKNVKTDVNDVSNKTKLALAFLLMKMENIS